MRSVAKHSYIKGGKKARARAKAHVNYLQYRPGEDREKGGSRPFFDKDNDRVLGREVKDAIDRQEQRGVVVHKLILSPGCEGVDLQQYTREVMEEFGKHKGLDLDWKAVAHTNTDHDHVHVIIMGMDEKGRQVRFDPRQDYTKLRELQDRYIEREHKLERFLDREMSDLLKERGFNRDGGDRDFQKLITGDDREDEDRSDKKRGKDKETEKDKDRDDREFRKLDKDLKRAFEQIRSGEIGRTLSRGEHIRRQQGRLQEAHATYTAQTGKQYWQELAERDPSRADDAQKQIDYINQLRQEQLHDNRWQGLDSLLGERHGRDDHEHIQQRFVIREHVRMHNEGQRMDDSEKSRDDEQERGER